MKQDNKKTGNRGESLASEYLVKKGYKIEERNFRTRFGEIDIVCWDGQTLVFVEVKTKKGHDFGEPEEMFNKNKMSQVKRMGEVYIEMNNLLLENTDQSNFSTRLAPSTGASLRQNWTVPSFSGQNIHGNKWSGLCRVDLVGIVLKENGEVEKLEHYEAVY